jgi:trimeric autotransporter adhesin
MPELHGWIFDDRLIAGESSTTPFQIYGHEGNDDLSATNHDDLLDGGTGADLMYGWLGDDIYVVDNAGDFVLEAEFHYPYSGGTDTVYSSITFTLPEFVENLSLMTGAGAINGFGNELENVIHGNESANTLEGRDGDDLLIGHDGNDTLRGGNNNDELYGGDHSDTLEGGDGQDQLYGGNQNDTLDGGANDDTLDGGAGADEMRGGTGNDSYFVDNAGDDVTDNGVTGIDTVYSSISFALGDNLEDLVLTGSGAVDGTGNTLDNLIAGNGSDNEIRGNDGEDLLKGGGGADTLRGGNQNDELHGESGDDILRGDGGDDEMFGGLNDDRYFVNSAGDFVGEDLGEGRDTVFVTGLENYTLTANVEELVLVTGDNGTGNASNNTITGNILDNIIDGAGGQDTMEGRQGDDTYFVNQANDIIVEAADQGDDTVLTSVNYTLSAGVEVETLRTTNDAGTAAINLTGNAFNNALIGNNGANTLSGRGGSDGIDGRGGIDTVNYLDSTAGVVVVLGQNGAPGLAYEFALVNNQPMIVSVDTLVSIENVEGSTSGDTLVGNEQINQLRGFNGNDIYVVQNAGDTIIELANQGLDEVRTSVSYTLAATNADIETFRTTDETGTAPINLTGNGVANLIVGNAGNNQIAGGGGADQIIGARGTDTLIGGSESDTFIWRETNETGTEANFADVITDFNFGAGDRIDLSQIDANLVASGNQAFQFIGQNAFTLNTATPDPSDVVPGQVRYIHSNGDTLIQLQTGTSPDVEAVIRISGIVTPEASWFVL